MTYKMTTINGGTRIRADHNVFAAVLTSVNANVQVSSTELWTAPADGSEVKAGDKWLKVTANGVTGWMAYIHKGVAICTGFIEDTGTTPPSEPILYPESVVWEYVEPSTKQTVRLQYKYEKIVG